MNPMPELIPMLKQLRLSGILDSLESRNRQAIEKKLSYMDFLGTIITDEIARRTQKSWPRPFAGPTSGTRKPWRNLTLPSILASIGR